MKPIHITNRCKTQPFVVVGCIIKKDDKFLLVQEGLVERGKWNQPAGWLDLGEEIINGAKRETEEETGLKIKIVGFLGVYSHLRQREDGPHHAVKFIFAAEAVGGEINFDPAEILDAKWFTLAEIKKLGDKLRDEDIINEIENLLSGKVYPTEMVENFYNQIQN